MYRILVVDDEPLLLETVEPALTSAGFDVTGAGTVKRARERLARTRFDLLLIDWIMPGQSGLDLAADAKASGLPVLMMTGALETEALDAAGLPCLRKPFKLE